MLNYNLAFNTIMLNHILIFVNLVKGYFFNASIPGNFSPAKNSSIAPPPVEMLKSFIFYPLASGSHFSFFNALNQAA